jgi:alkylated DNA repair dioxygenase AlkB
MRGIPFRATEQGIARFFDGCAGVVRTDVNIQVGVDGRPTGFAAVGFSSVDFARAAIAAKNMCFLGHRYVELRLEIRQPMRLPGSAHTSVPTKPSGTSVCPWMVNVDLECSKSVCLLGKGLLPSTWKDELFHILASEVGWQQKFFQPSKGKVKIAEPRLTYLMADGDIGYKYSGEDNVGQPWHPAVLEVKKFVESQVIRCGQPPVAFNACCLNFYCDGGHKIGPHSDDEEDLVPGEPIVSVSLGSSRRFVVHRKSDRKVVQTLVLDDGDVLLMGRAMQQHFKHSVPVSPGPGQRISMTFRVCRSRAPSEPITAPYVRNSNGDVIRVPLAVEVPLPGFCGSTSKFENENFDTDSSKNPEAPRVVCNAGGVDPITAVEETLPDSPAQMPELSEKIVLPGPSEQRGTFCVGGLAGRIVIASVLALVACLLSLSFCFERTSFPPARVGQSALAAQCLLGVDTSGYNAPGTGAGYCVDRPLEGDRARFVARGQVLVAPKGGANHDYVMSRKLADLRSSLDPGGMLASRFGVTAPASSLRAGSAAVGLSLEGWRALSPDPGDFSLRSWSTFKIGSRGVSRSSGIVAQPAS